MTRPLHKPSVESMDKVPPPNLIAVEICTWLQAADSSSCVIGSSATRYLSAASGSNVARCKNTMAALIGAMTSPLPKLICWMAVRLIVELFDNVRKDTTFENSSNLLTIQVPQRGTLLCVVASKLQPLLSSIATLRPKWVFFAAREEPNYYNRGRSISNPELSH